MSIKDFYWIHKITDRIVYLESYYLALCMIDFSKWFMLDSELIWKTKYEVWISLES